MSEHDYHRFMMLMYLCNSDGSVKLENVLRGNRGSMLDTLMTTVFSLDRGEPIVDIGAYCLMPNHFHILVHEKMEGGISKFMLKLGTAYTMYFNKKKERTGALFEGPFRATHVDEDTYLKHLLAYIHLNPVALVEPKWKESGIQNREVALEHLNDYRFSSYLDHSKIARTENLILNFEPFPEYFENEKDFETHIQDWLEYARSEQG